MEGAVTQDSPEQWVQLTQTQCFFLRCVIKPSFLLSQIRKDHIVSISCTSTQRKKSNQHKNKQYTSLSGSLAALSSSLSALKTVENHRKVLITLLNEWLYAGNWSLQNCVFPSDTSVVVESVWLYPSGLITNMVPSHKAKHNKS